MGESETTSPTTVAAGTGALAGIRVLDAGLIVQGPQAGQMLHDLGATVIKVELPEVGDQSRWMPMAPDDPRAHWFLGCNRGKRSITIDLRSDAGREVFLQLAETADLVISNFLPGTMEKWGLGYDDLAERNPGIIVGAGSAYGPIGPDAVLKGADIGGQAAGGLATTIGGAGSDIEPVGVTIADHIGSLNLTVGLLAALQNRHVTGLGQKIDVSLYGGQIFAQASELTSYFLTGRLPGPGGQGHPLLNMIYGMFPTADGNIAIVGVTPDLKPAFWKLLDRPDLHDDERFNQPIMTPDAKVELFAILNEVFQTQPSAHWIAALRKAGIRYSPVRDYAGVAADEGAYINGYLQRVDHPEWGEVSLPGSPIRMSRTPSTPGVIAPELGQHTEEVLLEAGYTWDEIGELRDRGAI